MRIFKVSLILGFALFHSLEAQESHGLFSGQFSQGYYSQAPPAGIVLSPPIIEFTSAAYINSTESRIIAESFSTPILAGPQKPLSQEMSLLIGNPIPQNKINLHIPSDEVAGSESGEDSGSFFSSNLFYFLTAAAVGTAVFLIYQDSPQEEQPMTFGYPPLPDSGN